MFGGHDRRNHRPDRRRRYRYILHTPEIFQAFQKEEVNSPEGTISVGRTERGRPRRDALESLIWLSQPYRVSSMRFFNTLM